MRRLALILVLIFLKTVFAKNEDRFPDDFKFGVSTSAYQIEGGWNASGKGESIWDRLVHTRPHLIKDGRTGDVACNSYHMWKTDMEILKKLGVQHYRFSISWPRILPTGFPNHINEEGVKYYNNIINSLIENNIEPLVTLYHFDLPQKLQELGGWTNLETATYFANYARVVFHLFGDRVKTWVTINEPSTLCEEPYENDQGAPAVYSPGIGIYLCARTVLSAHAKAYHIYDKEFRNIQKGKIGITIDAHWAEPKTNTTEDIEAAEREMIMMLGFWADPIFTREGDFPKLMKERVKQRSLEEGFIESRLPEFTKQEIDDLRGSADFFGLNHYFTWLIENKEYPIGQPSYKYDRGTNESVDPTWLPNFLVVPWGFYKLLKYISHQYNNPNVIITENGYPDNGELEDSERVYYHREYLREVLKAINEGCNIKQYTAWSLFDTFEWVEGYTVKYGIYHVDFSHPNRTRTAKAVTCFYRKVIKTKKIPSSTEKFTSSEKCNI